MRISDWSSDVCSSDLPNRSTRHEGPLPTPAHKQPGDHLGSAAGMFFTCPPDRPVTANTRRSKRKITGVAGLCTDPERPCPPLRSEKRRLGKEWVSTVRFRWAPSH